MKTQTLAIGNGESRLELDLHSITSSFETVGCNAICRDVNVDHLVCCDYRMVIESFEHITPATQLYLRDEHYQIFKKSNKYANINPVPSLTFSPTDRYNLPCNWGSGTYAVLLAAQLPHQHVYLIGFDLYSSTQLVNNVYKNTRNYASAQSLPVDPSYWIAQIAQVFAMYSSKQFVIVNRENWQLPEQWKLPNTSKISYTTFKNSL